MSRLRLPPLSALRAFEAAARRLSFRDAGDELCVTHSAVSHQVKLLERELGTPLFWRKGRRVELTEAGEALYPVLRDAFARIGETAARIRERGASGDLTVQVYVTVASRWLLPRLHRFEARNPDLYLRLSTSHRSWDFDAENVDVGMIYKEPPLDTALAWWPLFRARLVAVASPGTVQGGMGLRQPAELVNHRLLAVETAEADWALWLEAAGLGRLVQRRGPLFDSYLLALEAAIDGQGIALVPDFLAEADLKAGRIVEPFPLRVPQRGGWYLVCRKERQQDGRIARLRTWLAAEIAADLGRAGDESGRSDTI
ncbi:transcriptional regulator GcvA [Benzoatithermus flavus]|uniref:Transcriptional regulator GcvA n=1 Tax=Benzoatithermus flavus TaxID=3108223 RepID=A0ABU8XSD4_9PROT